MKKTTASFSWKKFDPAILLAFRRLVAGHHFKSTTSQLILTLKTNPALKEVSDHILRQIISGLTYPSSEIVSVVLFFKCCAASGDIPTAEESAELLRVTRAELATYLSRPSPIVFM